MFKPSAPGQPRRRLIRPPKLPGLSLNKLIPNILTVLALCAGLTSIRFALHGKWEHAVLSIVLAAILDGLDGRVARLLQGTSKFGAELDSLSDFVSFGVAPAMVLYFWTMQGAGGFGWALVLLFAVCCALRLARFNTMLGNADLPPYAYNFFTGIPAPAAAGVVLLPMVASFEFGDSFFARPTVVSVFLLGVAFLMVSTIPTFSFKKVRIPNAWVLPVLLIVGLLAAFLVTEPWLTLVVLGFAYVGLIPVSIRAFRRLKRQAEAVVQAETPVAAPSDSDENATVS
ncbi:CDP-diacylglycerol--serine O-phosphatidyltransferase [Magnetospirillum gryphiswaldense]|uniref:CDP-diacylglycerol--serine O-phosphatidyltransferase n=1 Tax=Magnetospirillum gryphiswaldense TaxID=55518 RepID=A4U2N6_9PROT|nr:CDP-diacylglycerol--serine O-phosphatidyltransferase [Magnetospirillum gryphiswaldense]AVM74780.1 CDP-alcohol phosphatidyltransferase [Magnetospirillum gryphiswaldense MSR-1]AVM78683.1 CDP-alcohol phosphatidyltransferase [Magnetospirillum gryphiswaldense]CAM77143.1 CDP-diacylglycerol--serine O-phosphatidyltransferase [Magnetospirillum gryphiswaldense MSR-1]